MIDPTTSAAAAATTTSSSGVTGQIPNGMGQDAFMKLLITQLQHQDPTAPQDDTQFVTQLAQFSSLEKLTSMDQMLNNIAYLLLRAVRPVTVDNTGTTTGTTGTTGTIDTTGTTVLQPAITASTKG
jgi:flagellar basal-body rod modification protein FlgD